MTHREMRFLDYRALGPTALLALLPLMLAGCGTDSARSGPAVRDSVGIQIVENTDYRWEDGKGWHLSESPILDIGALDGDSSYQLYDVAAALKLSDGRIAVANAGTFELRFYDAGGQFQGSAGRKGGGPGEFDSLLWMLALDGDTLLTYDWENRRVSIFDPHGGFVRAFTLQYLTETGGFPTYTAPFSDGSLLVATELFGTGASAMSTGVRRNSTLYVRCDTDGAVLDTLGRFPGAESYVKTDGEQVMGGPLALGRVSQAVVSGDFFYYGSSDSYEIRRYAKHGTLDRVIRRAHSNLPVTPEDTELYIEQQIEEWGEEGLPRQALELMFADMPFPEKMPAYREFRVDAEGNLWVQEYLRPSDDRPRWTVFDPEGAMLGEIEMPPRFEMFQIGSDFVLGLWRDDLDIEHVRIYELVKGS
jgi:hypothetical protein